MRHSQIKLCILGGASIFAVSVATAEPTGGVITAGSGVVHPEQGQTTSIDQNSDRLIIEWQGFDVDANERVEFNQPNASSIALNRILSGAPSTIAGQISANGQVFLINRDGIVFTGSANIDVNSLLATSVDINDANFMADNFEFDQPGARDATIVNRGTISASDAGLIGFVAPNVENSGLIQANLGTVVLAAGDAFTLDFFGDNLVTFAAAPADDTKTGSVTVSGDIRALNGTIVLSASQARDFINTVINVESDLVARSASMTGGKIILSGGDKTDVTVSGELNATGRDGGEISIDGRTVNVTASASLLADGDQGMGDGGTITVNSRERTEFAGLASAEPGASSGQGGDITLASDGLLIFSGEARAGLPPRAGTITLTAGGGSTGGNTGGGNTGGSNTGGGSTGGNTGGGSTGGNTGGGSTGGNTGNGGSSSGPVSGGGTPIIVVPPSATDDVADSISEIVSFTPIESDFSGGTGDRASATVFFGDNAPYEISSDGQPIGDNDDNLMCLHGVSQAACGDASQ